MALAAPGRFDGQRLDAAASARSDVGSPRGVLFTDIVDVDSKTGNLEWGRPGFVFSARVGGRRSDGLLLLETPFGRLGVRGEYASGAILRLRVERSGAGFSLRLIGRGTELSPISERTAKPVPLPEAALLRTLGLPVDALSASLVSFARAFGLGLDPSALKSLRRTALRSPADREASSLAAVAAEAKGVRLTDEALGEYAESIDAHANRERSGGGQSSDGEERRRFEPPSAEELRRRFATVAASGDALSFLNALPASDGTRWIVFPVELRTEDVEFRAVVRILLLATHGPGPGRVGRWAVDVMAGGRAWAFDADCLGSPYPSLRVSADPPLGSSAERVRAALAAVFEPFGHVVQVSALREERRFQDLRSGLPAVLDAEA